MWIAEATHAAERSKVVIEGPVLLHQDHDVLHIAQRAGALGRRNFRRRARCSS
jgi:hypothetical protein